MSPPNAQPLLTDTHLAEFCAYIADNLGLHYPRERWRPELERKIKQAAQALGYEDTAAFVSRLVATLPTQANIESLACHLTIGETHFFREPQLFALLETRILPELVDARRNADRRLRLWSAGCASGEEAYSLAIAVRRTVPDIEAWRLTLLATDINTLSLRRAADGVYSEWSFRGTPSEAKKRYFDPIAKGKYAIRPEYKQLVLFNYLNLAEDSYPSIANHTQAMDVIFCRNVLMHLTAGRVQHVIQNLHRALVDGGWLFVSPTEVSQSLFSQFESVHFPNAIAYRKHAQPRLTPVGDIFAAAPATPALPPPVFIETGPSPLAPEPIVPPAPEPPPAPTPYEAALALYDQGRYAAAAETLRGQSAPAALALQARALANLGQMAAALDACEKALAGDIHQPALHYLCGAIQQEMGAIDAAKSSLRRALYLDPDFVMAHFAAGNLALQEGRAKEAAKHFGNALLLLEAYAPEHSPPEADGMTADHLTRIIQATQAGSSDK